MLPYRMKNIWIAQSPPAPHQGVLILAKRPVTNCQPVLPDLWTNTLIATKMHIMEEGTSQTT